MKLYISYFQNIRYFKPNQIPISTSIKWPFWIRSQSGRYIYNEELDTKIFIDKNNVVNNIIEYSICYPVSKYETLTEQCSRNCPYAYKSGKCQFMSSYKEYLDSIDFDSVISDFEEIARLVKTINNYEEEPEIILMVYEHPRIKCAERPVLQQWFKEHNYELTEWRKDDLNN